MQFVGLIVSIGVAVVFSLITYNIFGNSGFKGVVTFKMALQIILLVVSTMISSVPFNLQTMLLMIPTILGSFIGVLISTSIEYYAYNKSNSFFTFLIYNILIGIFIALGLTAVLFILMCFIDPSLLSNNIMKLILLTVLIIIVIIVIFYIIKYIQDKKIEKNINYKIKNNKETIDKEKSDNEEDDSMSFCPNCGFKLARDAKFCMRCGKHFNNN